MSDTLTIHSKLKIYSVHFVENLADVLLRHNDEGSFFLVDLNVFEQHKGILTEYLPKERTIFIEVSENNKSMEFCSKLIEDLVRRNIRRDQSIVAIGGGIVQDISSFTASILYRGIDWSFVPTTLLAQADSCIGGKTSINLGNKKNLVGSFYPPSQVYLDVSFLNSLPVAELKSGIGEILHYYIYADSPQIVSLMEDYERILETPALLAKHIRTSLAIKKEVIEVDEFDRGERNKFNYGHTFGHALESLSNYEINHGQAVTLGMDIANYLSTRLGIMKNETYKELHGILSKNLPVFDMSNYAFGTYFEALANDKKNIGNNLGCILAEKKGKLFKKNLAFDDKLKSLIMSYFKLI